MSDAKKINGKRPRIAEILQSKLRDMTSTDVKKRSNKNKKTLKNVKT